MASLAEKVATFASVTGIEDQSLSRRILKVCVCVFNVVVVVSKFRPPRVFFYRHKHTLRYHIIITNNTHDLKRFRSSSSSFFLQPPAEVQVGHR